MADLSKESETLHESRIPSLSVKSASFILRVESWKKVDQEVRVQINSNNNNNNNNLRVS